MSWKIICALGGAIVLNGCAGIANEVQIDWEHGARRGTVTRVIDAAVLPDQRPACLAALPAAMFEQQQYVELEYRHRRHLFLEAGALPAGVQARPGDVVEFYPKNCDAGQLSRLTRVLPSSAR